jgi:transglutaminase-like putative cysteine protease
MTADPALRLSTFLTLGLACVALGAAEFSILPEVAGFAAAVVVALAVVYRLGGRAEVLSPSGANNVGLATAFAGAGWAAVRVVREVRVGEFIAVGWGVFFVLLLAPVLMALSVSFLLRRDKDDGIYWYVHAIGLAVVVLAAAIARRPWEVAALVIYAAAAVWGLARFALARGGAAPTNRRRAGLPAAAGWFALAVLVATPVFGVTPAAPPGIEKFELTAGRIEVGYSPDQAVDLTRTGELTPTPAVMFVVAAEQGGKPKLDLAENTRWRGRVLAHYAQGTWRREALLAMPLVAETAGRAEPWRPPTYGPASYRLTYTIPGSLRSDFLAEPVVWFPGGSIPVVDVFDAFPPRPWHPLADGSFFRHPGRPDQSRTLRYVQHTAPLPDPDLGVGFLLSSGVDQALTANPITSVRNYSTRLLQQLVRERKLPDSAGAVSAVTLRPTEEHHEAVARAFAAHLSESPEFSYTLTLTRPRPDLDPVEEFLEHTKAGHCERYASALVLMLRSQGIPAALVHGFKGHEPVGDGSYNVRQDHAHTWATALVSRPDAGGGRVWHWLSLDPSPSGAEAAAGTAAAHATAWTWVWNKLLDATPEERLSALGELATNPVAAGIFAGVVALGGLAWGVLRVRRARAAAGPTNSWLDPLYAVLAPHGYTPAADETPWEFAARVAAALTTRPGTATVASVPPAWVERYYEERFGGAAATPVRITDLDALRAALSAPTPGGTR